MARGLQVNDRVFVPSSLLPDADNYAYAMHDTHVVECTGRKIRVRGMGGVTSGWLPSSKAHRLVGIAIIRIGDFATENTLLNPLTKSVSQYCRLIIEDSAMTIVQLRAMAELAEWWRLNAAAFSHVIFIGHGSRDGIGFGIGGTRKADDFNRRLISRGMGKKVFISLCCETGNEPFVKEFSRLTICESLIAPAAKLHGALASQFTQTFLAWTLLNGKTTTVAFKQAINAVPAKHEFKLWRNGALAAG